MRVIKKDAIIKGVDFSVAYYERLHGLVVALSNNPDNKEHLETALILVHTLDKAAEEQGLIEEMEIPSNVIPLKE